MKKTFLIALFCALQSVTCLSQTSFNTLDELWNYALKNNTNMLIHDLHIQEAKIQRTASLHYLYPKVAGNFSSQYNISLPETPVPGELSGKPGETVYLKFGQEYSYNTGISINKSVLDWQAHYQSKIAKLTIELRETQKDYDVQILKEQIAQLYYAALVANMALAISDKNLQIADSLYYLSDQRFGQGIIDEFTYNQSAMFRLNMLKQNIQAQQYADDYTMQLKLIIGMYASDTLVLSENLEYVPETDFVIASNEIPGKLSGLQTEISAYEVKKALSAFTPKIDIVKYFGYQQFQNDFNLKFDQNYWKPNSYLGLSVTIPLFTGFVNTSSYKTSKIEYTIAQEQWMDMQRRTIIEDSMLYNKCIANKKQLEIEKELYITNQKNEKLAGSKYARGIINQTEYLMVLSDMLVAQNNYLSSLSELLISIATIKSKNHSNKLNYE